MQVTLTSIDIRTRLLIVYVGILIIGFIALTIVAGGQISSAARADYEQRLQNEIRLIAQGVRSSLTDSTMTEDALNQVIAGYEAQSGGKLTLFRMDEPNRPFGRPPQFQNSPEVETAVRGDVIIVERRDDTGIDMLYTAASISDRNRLPIIVQLRVPLANLQMLVWERWASLGLVFGLITIVALLAAVQVSRSIIHPLYALRDSAAQLSKGDFSHRIVFTQKDEIGEVARAFNEMARQVESMLEEQRAFASNTSHELRTPLTTIRLRTEALRYDEQLDEETARRYTAEIDDEANRMGSLIEDLTLLSRFDVGRAKLGENQIDIAHFASSLKQSFVPQLTARHISFELSASSHAQPIFASLNHLTVVFRNLLDNAIKYTPDGGKISWCISAGGDGIRSVVEDNGRGVHPDQLPHLFERFYRADKSRSRDIPGSGLGLAIVKSIVEAYGGSISIESQGSGQGTSVTVFWPYKPVGISLENAAM